MMKKTLFFLGVIVITFACFIPDLSNDLLSWDDNGYIQDNVYITSLSFETIGWALTTFYCNYWAPLTWLSLALDYAVWGLDPFGYHLTNNIIHAFNAGLFFLITYHLLGRYAAKRTSASVLDSNSILSCSLLAALFFGIHPLRVESVAWAAERKDVLSTIFGMGSVLAYLRYTKDEDAQHDCRPPAFFLRSFQYWTLLLLYGLSLLSKSMLITLPLVLLVLDWFPLQRMNRESMRKLVLEKLPLLFLAALSSIITVQALGPTHKTLAEINLMTRVLVAFKSILQYLQFMLLPVNISPVYFHPGNVTIDIHYSIFIAIVVAITAYCLLAIKRQPVFFAAWLIFLITLQPVLGLTQNGPQEMAPRFTYIPGLATSLLAALGVVTLLSRFPGKQRIYVWIGVLLILASFAFLTVRNIGFWKNDIALWSRVIEIQPHVFGKAYFQRSLFLNLNGEYQKALSDVNEALAIASRKKYGGIHEIYAHRARILKNINDYDGAIADLSKAIELSGEPYSSQYYGERGALFQEKVDFERSKKDFMAAELVNHNK